MDLIDFRLVFTQILGFLVLLWALNKWAFGPFVDANAQGLWFDDVSYSVADQASVVCRPSAGQCDVADYCDGATNDCPADAFAPDTTTCTGVSTGGACDTQDFCLGTANSCVDKYLSATTVCRAAAPTS